MRYINTKTGAVIDSPCTISGGDWVEEAAVEKDKEDALENMNVKQLKAIAEQMDVDLSGVTKKADIIEAIAAVKNDVEEQPDEEEGDK